MTDDRPEHDEGALPSRREARGAEAAGEPATAADPPTSVEPPPAVEPPSLVEPEPEPDAGPPTEPVAIEDLTTQAVPVEQLLTPGVPMGALLDPPPPANVDAPTELLVDASALDPAPSGPSTLDTVFGDAAFVEYQDEPLLARRPDEPRPARRAAAAAPPTAPGATAPAPGLPRSQKVLIGIAIGLGVLVAAIAAFIIGTRLPGLVGFGPVASTGPGLSSSVAPVESASPTASPSATPTPSPEPSETVAPATGPLPAGVHDWDALVGGECLDPFVDPWQEEYTVVDCAAPHAAQLIVAGTLPGEEVSAYPGEEALAAEIPTLCRTAGLVDLGVASAFRDLQVAGSYPVSAEDWADGERTYRCFVTRSSGEPITGSLTPPIG